MSRTLLSKNWKITHEEGDEQGWYYELELRLAKRDGLEEIIVSSLVLKCSINGDNRLLAQFCCRSNLVLGRHSSSHSTRM